MHLLRGLFQADKNGIINEWKVDPRVGGIHIGIWVTKKSGFPAVWKVYRRLNTESR